MERFWQINGGSSRRARWTRGAVLGLLVVAGACGGPAPASAASLPCGGAGALCVSSAKISSTNLLTVTGTVRSARPAWRVRVQARVARVGSRTTRHVWVTRADSSRLVRSGRYSVSCPAGGPSATIRILVMSGRRIVATGKAMHVAAIQVVRPPGAAPVRTPVAIPTPKPPTGPVASPTPSVSDQSPAAPGTPSDPPAPPASTMAAGSTLRAGERLVSPNAQYSLVMQGSDGNLVLYRGSTAVWSTGATGGGSRAEMQGDGNLVVYNGANAKWSSSTAGFGGAMLALQDDGNLVIYHSGRGIWTWSSGYMGNALPANGELSPGAFLLSADRQYMLVMQGSDGNLVLYRNGTALWNTGARGAGSRVVMQGDGNLVIYKDGAAQWASHTAQFPGATLALQNDGNVVVYHSGRGIWTWGGGYIGDVLNPGADLPAGAYLRSPNRQYLLVMQPEDGNLVLYGPSSALWAMHTAGHPGARAVMQPDGNFVVYAGVTALAATHTAGQNGAHLRLQDDANLVIYRAGAAVWSRIGVNGPHNFLNSSIADRAEARANGTYVGRQCLEWATDMIVEAGGPRFWFGDDTNTYQSQWAQRATRIESVGEARRGDIVQWGGGVGGTLDPHTAIITAGGSNTQVIDSNYAPAYGKTVNRGSLASRSPAGSVYRIWRVGRI